MIRTFRNRLQEFKVIIEKSNVDIYFLSVFYKDIYSHSLNYKEYKGLNRTYEGIGNLDKAIEELVKKHNLNEVS